MKVINNEYVFFSKENNHELIYFNSTIYYNCINLMIDVEKCLFTNENIAHVVSATLILTSKV